MKVRKQIELFIIDIIMVKKTFRFALDGTANGFQKEFQFGLKLHPGKYLLFIHY